eukprot:g9988.t1
MDEQVSYLSAHIPPKSWKVTRKSSAAASALGVNLVQSDKRLIALSLDVYADLRHDRALARGPRICNLFLFIIVTIIGWSAEPKPNFESTTNSHTSTETTEPGPSPKGSSLIDDPPASGLGPVAGE